MKKLLGVIISLFFCISLFSQGNVGIGTTTPNPNAILELVGSDQGLLLPRGDSSVMYSLLGAADKGMLLYDTIDNQVYTWNGNHFESGGGADTDWTEQSGNVFRTSGFVGIATNNPLAELSIGANNYLGIAGPVFYIGKNANFDPIVGDIVATNTGPLAVQYFNEVEAGILLFENTPGGTTPANDALSSLKVVQNGTVIGGDNTRLNSIFDVKGTAAMDTIIINNGNPTNVGDVLTVMDASGRAYWAPASGSAGGIYDGSGSLSTSPTVVGFNGNNLAFSVGTADAFVGLNAGGSWTFQSIGSMTSEFLGNGNVNLGRTLYVDYDESRVGIGINDPDFMLHLRGDTIAVTREGRTFIDINHALPDFGTYIRFSQDGNAFANPFYIGADYDATQYEIWGESYFPMLFATNNLERMRIDEDGDVMIGTTTPFNTSTRLTIDDATATGFSGMYINTATTGEPFYGYGLGNAIGAYTYVDGASKDWIVNVDGGNHFTVTDDGFINLVNGVPINEFSSDGTLADNSHDAVPTERAVKTYVDAGKVAFKATNLSNSLSFSGGGRDALEFNTEIYDLPNNSYDPGTASFTAPSEGIYHFTAGVIFPNIFPGRYQIEIYVNGFRERAKSYNVTDAGFWQSFTISGDIRLNTGDVVNVEMFISNGNNQVDTFTSLSEYSFFSGHKVY